MNPEIKTAFEHIAYIMLRSAHSRFRQHARDIQAAFLVYGDHGPTVSGRVRSHFPENVKETLRKRFRVAHEDLEMSLAYWKLAGRHARTWRIVADKALHRDGMETPAQMPSRPWIKSVITEPGDIASAVKILPRHYHETEQVN